MISYGCFTSIEYRLLECIDVSETIGVICLALYLNDVFTQSFCRLPYG